MCGEGWLILSDRTSVLAQHTFYDGDDLVEILWRDRVHGADDIGRMPVEIAGLVDFDVAGIACLRNSHIEHFGVLVKT